MVEIFKKPQQGYRKYIFGMRMAVIYAIVCSFLGYTGFQAGSDATALGIMFGGFATGLVGIMTAFVYGNAKVHEATNGSHSDIQNS